MTKLRGDVIEGQLEERLHCSSCLLDGNAGFETRKGSQNHLPCIRPAIGRPIESGGNKNVVVAEVGHLELRREDPYYDSGPAVEGNRVTGKVTIAGEAGTPQSIRDERDTRCVRPVFVACEIPPKEGLNPKRRQECGFNERALQTDGVPFGEIAIGSARHKGCNGLERSLRFLPVHVIRTEHELIRFERRFIAKADQAFVVGIRQAAEQNTVDHAEDRRGGPDSQSESEYCYQREPRAFPQSSKSKAQILQQRIEKWNGALLAIQFFGLLDAAECATSSVARVSRTHAAVNVFLCEHL